MTLPDLVLPLLVLLICVCLFIFLVSVMPRGMFGGMRPAGDVPMEKSPAPSLRAAVWLMVPVGAVLLGAGLRLAVDESRTWRWNAVPGTLVEARVEPVTETRYDLFRRRIAMRRYAQNARYAYRAGGKDRTGERVRLREGSVPWRSWAEWSRRGLEPGKAVTVYVDPEDPNNAILRRGWQVVTVALVVAGLTLCVLAVVLI